MDESLRRAVMHLAATLQDWLPPHSRQYIWVPAVFLMLYISITVTFRWIIPNAGRALTSTVVIHTAAAMLMLINFLLALPFRGLGRRVPHIVYRAGDGSIATVERLYQLSAAAPRVLRQIANVRAVLRLVVSLLLVVW